MTDAHCNSESFQVLAQEHQVAGTGNGADGTRHNVARVIPHPQYDSSLWPSLGIPKPGRHAYQLLVTSNPTLHLGPTLLSVGGELFNKVEVLPKYYTQLLSHTYLMLSATKQTSMVGASLAK